MEQIELIHLFSKLHDNLNDPDFCESQILMCIDRRSKDSNELVHMMNALYPIKDKLPSWSMFIQYCIDVFIETDRPLSLIRASHESLEDYVIK